MKPLYSMSKSILVVVALVLTACGVEVTSHPDQQQKLKDARQRLFTSQITLAWEAGRNVGLSKCINMPPRADCEFNSVTNQLLTQWIAEERNRQ